MAAKKKKVLKRQSRKQPHKQSKRNLIQQHNLHFAVASIAILAAIIFLPLVIDPVLDITSAKVASLYVTTNYILIGFFAVLSIYSGYHGMRQSTHHLHWSVYVTALTVGILTFIQFLWLGLPAIFR